MLRLALPFALLLLLPTLATADTIRGEVELVSEPSPTQRNPDRTVDGVRIQSGERSLRISDADMVSTLRSFEGHQVVLEGTCSDDELTVAEIVEPRYHEGLSGILYRTRRGFSGLPKIELEGRAIALGSRGYLALLKITKDMKRREIVFNAYAFRDGNDRLEELVVTGIQATAKEDLVLTEAVFAYRGGVPAGTQVWILRRSLWGLSARVAAPNGNVGFALWSRLEIGEVVDSSAKHEQPANHRGLTGARGLGE